MDTQQLSGPAEQILPNGKSYTVAALRKATSESSLEGSLAQNLFNRWWEEALSVHDDVPPMPKSQAAIDSCFRIAEEFRKKLHLREFDKRERYDKEERERFKSGGKTLIHIPDAGEVAPFVPGGYIPGMEQ